VTNVKVKQQSNPYRGLDRPFWLQEVERHMNVVRFSALRTYPPLPPVKYLFH